MDPWIIDDLNKRKREQPQPYLEIPLEYDVPASPDAIKSEEGVERGVVVINLWDDE